MSEKPTTNHHQPCFLSLPSLLPPSFQTLYLSESISQFFPTSVILLQTFENTYTTPMMGTTLPGINQLPSLQAFSMNKENRAFNHYHHYSVVGGSPSSISSSRDNYFEYKPTSSTSGVAAGGFSPSDSTAPPLLHYSSAPNYSYSGDNHHQHRQHHHVTSIQQGGLRTLTSQPQYVYSNNNTHKPSLNNLLYQQPQPLVSPLEAQSSIKPLRAQSYDAGNLRLPSIQELVAPTSQPIQQPQQQQVHMHPGLQVLNQQIPSAPHQHYNSSNSAHTIHHIGHIQPKKIRKRTRTGCLTCRKRRIKCDERKPSCMNCEKSKKCCAGYVDITTKKKK